MSPFFSGASRISDYVAVSRAVTQSSYTWSGRQTPGAVSPDCRTAGERGGMDAEPLGQFRQRRVAFECRQGHLRLTRRAVIAPRSLYLYS